MSFRVQIASHTGAAAWLTLHDDVYRCHEVSASQDDICEAFRGCSPEILRPGKTKAGRENRWLMLHSLADLVELRSRADDPNCQQAVLVRRRRQQQQLPVVGQGGQRRDAADSATTGEEEPGAVVWEGGYSHYLQPSLTGGDIKAKPRVYKIPSINYRSMSKGQVPTFHLDLIELSPCSRENEIDK